MAMDMNKMMKQAQQMQAAAERAQEEIAQMEFTATSGGGMVEACVKGDMTVKSIVIDPAAVDPEDVDMLQDLVMAAVNEALRSASEATNEHMNSAMGGMSIPGLM